MKTGRRAKHVTDEIWPGLWELLWRWAEWYSGRGSAQALQIKDSAIPNGTAPKSTTKEEELYRAILKLNWAQVYLILAVMEREAEPWLEGKEWKSFLADTKLTPKSYTKHLRIALTTLAEEARKRGL